MPRTLASPRRIAALALALAATAAPTWGRAEGFSLRLEPGYAAATNETVADGVASELETTAFRQRYGLTLDKTLWPLVRLSAGGLLDWIIGTTTSPLQSLDTDTKRLSGYARLDMGGPMVRWGGGYDRNEERTRSEPAGAAVARSPTLRRVREVYTAYGLLDPEGLPSLDLRVSRTNTNDGALVEVQEDNLLLNVTYQPVPQLELRYSGRLASTENRVSGTDTLQLNQLVRTVYQDSFLDKRLSVYGNYDFTRLDSEVTVTGTGGTVSEQQFPFRGLSAIEVIPVPESTVLEPNPALVDGNLAASAGLDLGYSVSPPRPRHMGVQFSDAVTPVNALYVWVDRPLPPEVVAAYAWDAYQSDDNVDWTPVAVTGPAVFGTFQNRFEIPIAETRARYLKVVTTPLPVGITLDPQFANVLVTEVQTYRVQAAEDVRGRQSTTSGLLNGGVRYQFASVPGLSYDFATFLRHGTRFDRPSWSVSNGLGYVRNVRPSLLLSARLDRTDSDEGQGRESSSRYAVTLAATPLPTLTASGTVSGVYTQMADGGSELRNAVLLAVTADLYQGVAVMASGSVTHGETDTGRTSRAFDGRATASFVPHRTLSLSTTFAAYETRLEGGGLAPTGDSIGRLEATGSFTPFPALYLSSAVTWYLWGDLAPATLANFGVTVSPLPGSPLLFRFTYLEFLDTSQDLRSRTMGPGLRWTIRPRWFLDVTYTWFDSKSPTVETHNRVFFANFLAVIG